MNVEIISATQFPIDVISRAAGTCYGKDDCSGRRAKSCYNAGHMSVFEHASVTFRVEGISRACSHQLVRHRLASYSQESQRYCKYDLTGDDWYVMPEEWSKGSGAMDAFADVMRYAALMYGDAVADGMKPEDARYILPEATKTTLVVTMNVREFFHFVELRTDSSAQWEIRELANAMIDELASRGGQWRELMMLLGDHR